MALAANGTHRSVRSTHGLATKIVNTEVVYDASFLAIRGPDFATSGSRGYIDVEGQAKGEIPVGGFAEKGETGDTGANPIPRARYSIEDQILERIAVTGVTAIGDVGKVVYMSGDGTLTLTRPTRGIPRGMIVEWYTSTTCDVLWFGMTTLLSVALGGNGQELMYLGSFDCDTITAANLRTAIPMPFHGAFLTLFAMIDVAPAGSGGTALINLEIGGTNVAGGVVTVATGDVKGAKNAGTAITGDNIFHEGDTVDVEAATVTDMSAGRFDLFAEVERRPGV